MPYIGKTPTPVPLTSEDIEDNTVGAAELKVAGDGTDSQFLRSNADGTFSWSIPPATNTDLVNDTTPELGGNLDGSGYSITADDFIGPLNGAVQFTAKNDEGVAITKGQAVYIKGISGDVATVGLADANDPTKMPAFGLVFADANSNAEVEIVTFGSLKDTKTDYTGWSLGDTLYVSTTAGALTNSAPTGESSSIQNIGKIQRVHATAGIIKVGGAGRTNATPNLDDGNVFIGNASNQAVSVDLSTVSLPLAGGTMTGAITTNSTFDGRDVSVDGAKLDGISASANNYTHPANHAISVITGLQTALDGKAPLASPALTGTPTAPTAAANTNTTQVATTAYVQGEITDLIGGAPGALDTLNELAAAINEDASYASTITSALGGKVATSSNQALSTAANAMTASGSTITLNRGDGTTDTVTVPDTNTTYSAGTGLDLSGTTFSIESDLRDGVTHVGRDNNDYIEIGTDRIRFYVNGVRVMSVDSAGNVIAKGGVTAFGTPI